MTLDELADWLHELPERIGATREDLHHAAENQLTRIKTRTAQGVSYEGEPFAPYAKGTRDQGADNLEKTGAMMNSLQVESTPEGAQITVSDPSQLRKVMAHNFGTKYMPARPFLGVNQQDRIQITNDLRDGLKKRLK